MDNSTFITDDFILQTEPAKRLYHEYAENQPIIDYHCHLSPKDIAEDIKFENLAQLWLYGDHYKWRQMRTNGIDEKYCTGDASDYEKFLAFAKTMPNLLKNPIYHWSHLELKALFGINDRLLNPDTAQSIWDECNEKLSGEGFSSRGIMEKFNVKLVCTTDDPTDSLEYHKKIHNDKNFSIKVLPTFRPDKGMLVESSQKFNDWVNLLAQSANLEITNFTSYIAAIRKRHDYFHENGCRLSDHGVETIYAEDYTETEINSIFSKVRSGKELSEIEIKKFKSAMLYEFGIMNYEKGWTQQFHLGALRNNNSRLFNKLGPDVGFDSIGDWNIAVPLSKMLDNFDKENKLTKTIIYNLNPKDNELVASMIGNFQDGSIAGKIQFGSGWWFLDQKSGMERQIDALSNLGMLSQFVGMLTDSRSFLSYPRHEYFRRILCNILGNDISDGLIPNDYELVGNMVKNICYGNASKYFGFDLS